MKQSKRLASPHRNKYFSNKKNDDIDKISKIKIFHIKS